jgi:hypothetical protein
MTRFVAAALLVLTAGAARADEPPPAAETREGEWRRLRDEKAAHLVADEPGRLERNLLALEKAERPSLAEFSVAGFYPRFQNIASGSQVAGGVRLWRPDLFGSAWDLHGSAFYSLRGYEYYDLQLGRLPHRGRKFPPRAVSGDDVYELGDVRRSADRLIAYASARYDHSPRIAFYGLGPDTPRSDRTTFLLQDASYDLVAGWQFDAHRVVTVRAGYVQAFVGRGEDPHSPTLSDRFHVADAPGLAGQPDFWRWSVSALLDHRDQPGNPHRGTLLAVSYGGFDDRGGSAYAFHRAGADARAFVPLGSPQRVLALRLRASTDSPSAGAAVPFYLQEALGGSHSLRAFPSFRFRGERLFLAQSEYRWEAWPAVEMALFVDVGAVGREGEGPALSRPEADWGLGLRLKGTESTLLRLDVAWGRDGSRWVLRLGPSF